MSRRIFTKLRGTLINYMDNYGFHVAKVVSTATITDNRLQVKVLPYMDGIDDDKCPVWSSFFKDGLYTGQVGDYVWVICDDEYSVGYVFGMANYTTYSDVTTLDGDSIYQTSTDGISLSIPQDLRENITTSAKNLGLLGSDETLSLSNTKVTYWDDNCIHYIEKNTGGSVQAYRNGTLYIFRPDVVIIKIGNTVFRMNGTNISFKSGDEGEIQLQSPKVGLGKNPTNNVLINSAGSGVGAIPSEWVKA